MQPHEPMVQVPGGEVTLRDDRRKIEWTVPIRPFLLGRSPVTMSPQRIPLVNVSWLDAVALCNRLSRESGFAECYSGADDDVTCDWDADGYRLPTEAEWQYACKAETTGYRYGELDEIAWYSENSGGVPHPVERKAPNSWGLHDMLGNVWEWCWDLYDQEVYGSYRIFRGGSWAEEARGCGASVRRRSHPTFSIDDLGFRLARSSVQ
nr:formylglycine-generating enzyme family protein [Antrihabitans sp. YC2-6]